MRIQVPVKLSYPKDSDAIDNSNFTVTMPEGTKVTSPLTVNGESIEKAWVVGDGESQTLTINGYARDLIKALDVGFYASTFENEPAAMTIKNMNIWLQDPLANNEEKQIGSYTPLLNVIGTELEDDITTKGLEKVDGEWEWVEKPDDIVIGLAKLAILLSVNSGIPRDDSGSLCFLYLTKFINPQTITFNGLVSNQVTAATAPMIILDESPIYKEIKAEVINNFLSQRFVDSEGKSPTCKGLQDIVKGDTTSDDAKITASTLYNVLRSVFDEKGVMEMTVDVKPKAYDVDIDLCNVFDALIPSPTALMTILQTMKLELQVSTCPYHANKETGYGTKANPIPIDNITGDKNPIIFWGLDAYGPTASGPSQEVTQ